MTKIVLEKSWVAAVQPFQFMSSEHSLNSQVLHGASGIYDDTEDGTEIVSAVLAQQFYRSRRIN